MKSFLLLLISFFTIQANCQDTLINGVLYNAKYYKTGEISTLYPKLDPTKNISEAETSAFEKSGKKIYEQNVRRIAGYASVNYSYHENGGVKVAHFTSQPDGGIQRTDIKYSFDESGNLISKSDWSSDGLGKPQLLGDLQERPIKPQTELVKCAILLESEVVLVNSSSKKMKLLLTNYIDGKDKPEKLKLKPGEEFSLGTYVSAQVYDSVLKHFKLSINSSRKDLNLIQAPQNCDEDFQKRLVKVRLTLN